MKRYAKFGYAAPLRFRVILEKPQGGGAKWLPPPGRRLPSPGQGVDATPPWVFLSWTPHRLDNRAEIFHSLWGIFCATLMKKIWSSQVRSRSYDVIRGPTFDNISAKSWVNATWRGAIDLNGDSWWDWCRYMTGCDPWHCARWVSRSTKVTWGHWPRLNSQWQITNRHMFSGFPEVLNLNLWSLSLKTSPNHFFPSPWPIIVIRSIWILTVTAMTAGEGDAVLLRSTTYAKYCNGIH